MLKIDFQTTPTEGEVRTYTRAAGAASDFVTATIADDQYGTHRITFYLDFDRGYEVAELFEKIARDLKAVCAPMERAENVA